MQDAYCETGGIRYGDSFWGGMNFTWPFARLKATSGDITIAVSFLRLWQRTFTFDRGSIRSLARERHFLNSGLRIAHDIRGYAPFVLFWTFSFRRLKAQLQRLGYEVSD